MSELLREELYAANTGTMSRELKALTPIFSRQRKESIVPTDGQFLIAFDRDAGPSARLVAEAPDGSLADYLMDCERDYLRMVLDQHGGHMTHSAEALGITRKTLWEKMRRLGLQARDEP